MGVANNCSVPRPLTRARERVCQLWNLDLVPSRRHRRAAAATLSPFPRRVRGGGADDQAQLPPLSRGAPPLLHAAAGEQHHPRPTRVQHITGAPRVRERADGDPGEQLGLELVGRQHRRQPHHLHSAPAAISQPASHTTAVEVSTVAVSGSGR